MITDLVEILLDDHRLGWFGSKTNVVSIPALESEGQPSEHQPNRISKALPGAVAAS